jgi:hypothetical protein
LAIEGHEHARLLAVHVEDDDVVVCGGVGGVVAVCA